MLAIVPSATLNGLDGRLIRVEVDVAPGLPGFTIVGLADAALQEARERDLVVLDEAAWITSETFTAARPLTAASGGRLVIQSTPGSPVGPFYEMASKPPDGWAFMKVRSDEVPTISAEFLERERREMAPDLFAQEYLGEFGRGGGGLFTVEMVNSMFTEESA